MASEQNDTVFPEQDMDDDDDGESQEDDEEDYDDDDVLPDDEETQPSPSALAVTVAVPGSSIISNGLAAATIPTSAAATTIVSASFTSDPNPRRAEPIEEKKAPPDDSRRMFQRLWTDEDEIELLQGFLDYTSQRGSSHHSDTALFYDQIKSKLQLEFNKSQLVEKIRRLKKKYRNVLNRIASGKDFSFKTAHDQATFQISHKIWNNAAPIAAVEDNNNNINNAIDDDEINLNPTPNPNPNFNPSVPKYELVILGGNSTEKKTRKRSRPQPAIKTVEKRELNLKGGAACSRDRNFTTATTTTSTTNADTANNNCDSGNINIAAGVIEETLRSCLPPLLKTVVAGAMGGPFGARGLSPLGLMNLGFGIGSGELVDEKWRKQQILELEVYSKRLELVQDQVKVAMEELRSSGGGGR